MAAAQTGAKKHDWDRLKSDIIRGRRVGFSLRKCARMVGVPESSIRTYADTDPEFAEALINAPLWIEVELNEKIIASEKGWQAAMVWLKARFPDRYSENRVQSKAPMEVRFTGQPDAGMPKVHPMRAEADGA
jgi:lambda repressor-like predicted transcriptional regulator